jgi:hypothetical protein
MAGLVPAIHVFLAARLQNVDARHKAGHDERRWCTADGGLRFANPPYEAYAVSYCFNVIASPLRSRFAIRPTCLPLSSRIAPFWLVSRMPRTPAPNATPAPAAA